MILVDAHSLIFQVYYAIKSRMSSSSGMPTNALFGFTRDMFYLRDLKPDYLVCAFDVSEKTFRNDLASDYKANRDPMPNDLALQIPLIHQILDALSIPILSHSNYEADDVMATVARASAEQEICVWLCTTDKDCRQLIDDHVLLYNLRKKMEIGRAELMEDWGVTPEQVVDLQTLVGDPVDNVPGVPGIGLKTAAKLLQEYGTLENLLANIDKISGTKRRENLKSSLTQIALSRKLVTLADDVPLEMTWDDWRLKPWNQEKLVELLREWGFRTMLQHVQSSAAPAKNQQGTLFDQTEEELFAFGANVDESPEPASTWKSEYHLVNTTEQFQKFLKDLKKQKRFAVDLETTGLEALQCDLVGLAFSWQAEEAWYVPVRGPEGERVLNRDEVLRELKPILESATIAKVNQNIKYDSLVLRSHGIHLAGVTGDPMVADYLLNAGGRGHNLNDLTLPRVSALSDSYHGFDRQEEPKRASENHRSGAPGSCYTICR